MLNVLLMCDKLTLLSFSLNCDICSHTRHIILLIVCLCILCFWRKPNLLGCLLTVYKIQYRIDFCLSLVCIFVYHLFIYTGLILLVILIFICSLKYRASSCNGSSCKLSCLYLRRQPTTVTWTRPLTISSIYWKQNQTKFWKCQTYSITI